MGKETKDEDGQDRRGKPVRRKPPRRVRREPVSTIDISLPIEKQPAYLRIADVAALCRCKPRTVRAWLTEGVIRAHRPAGAGGTVLIPRAEVARLLGKAT